jgi:hypothetical protein
MLARQLESLRDGCGQPLHQRQSGMEDSVLYHDNAHAPQQVLDTILTLQEMKSSADCGPRPRISNVLLQDALQQ